MHKVIDTPWCTTDQLQTLKSTGVRTIIRYFNRSNSTRLPEKQIEPSEAQAIAEAGLSLVTVYQQGGGANGHIEELDEETGEVDAQRALELADQIGQPPGSAIYFAVDHDYWKPSELERILPYFAAVRETLQDSYRVGVYGSGTIGRSIRNAGLADLIWLASAKGWSGTRDVLATGEWALYQIYPPINEPVPHDGNLISPAWHDYGQFVPNGEAAGTLTSEQIVRAPNTFLMKVTARKGLKLRGGPSQKFEVETVLEHGSLVHAMKSTGDWIQVDIEGDGRADGYMFGEFLAPVIGGFTVADSSSTSSIHFPNELPTPYKVALAELSLGVKEVRGPGNNPRIVMYHNTTTGSGTDDSVAWCSSFVNYCVEQAGFQGTNSQWALSWENWGMDTQNDPREGDIVVFERVGKGGHVGFYREDQKDRISVLGGNQSDAVKVSSYPKDGQLGNFHYKLRSIRRA